MTANIFISARIAASLGSEAMPFSLDKAQKGKREASDGGEARGKKIPKVGDMVAEPPRNQANRSANATNAPVNIVVYPVSDNAGDMWSAYRDTPSRLFQALASSF